MPAFNVASELPAGVEYTIVVVLVVGGSCQAVTEHAFRKRWQRINRVLFQEGGSGRGVALIGRLIGVARSSELVEFVLG